MTTLSTDFGVITITLTGVPFAKINQYRKNIHTLLTQGALDIRAGKVQLSFDPTGELAAINFDFVKWRADKPALPLDAPPQTAIVEIQAVNQA